MARSRFTALIPAEEPAGPASKYDPEFCWSVREFGQRGMFPEEWVAELGVTLPTIYNWANANPDFEQALHEAHWLLRAYWAKQARDSKQGIGIPPTTLSLILQRRFPDMWGKNSVNLHDHFENRNQTPEAGADPSQKAIKNMTRDEIRERIEILLARRKQEE